MAKPNLAYIPATIGDKVYSILPNDGVGDFDFTRGTVATRINAQGLIETVASGENRLNYSLLDGEVVGCPHLLLEPSRTNLLQYSEQLSNWTNIQNVTVSDNDIISPDGTQNASKVNETTNNSVHRLFLNPTVTSAKHTYSVFLKKGTRSWAYLRLDGAQSEQRTWFDLENGVLGTVNSDHIASIENFGNGWYRCSVSIAGTTYDTTPLAILALSTENNVFSYAGGTDKYIYAWGAMLEQGSYPTSYIKTDGEVGGVTRAAETCNGSGNAATFNDSEGVLMAEISALADDGTSRRISLSSGSTSQRVSLEVEENANDIQAIVVSGTSQVGMVVSLDGVTLFNKIAFKYKENDFAIWANGFELDTDTVGITPTGLSELAFDDGGGGADFYGKTKQIQYYDTTDIDLEQLTSWDSFRAMAQSQLYTIE